MFYDVLRLKLKNNFEQSKYNIIIRIQLSGLYLREINCYDIFNIFIIIFFIFREF